MTASPRPARREGKAQAAAPGLSPRAALALVRRHGVVLVSAKGKAPNLVEAIAGEPIKGSWWGHPDGKRIYAVLSAVTECEDVLVCRLVDGKITLVHRRLWPALVRLAHAFPPERISRVLDGHTAAGHHVSRALPFPAWVEPVVAQEADALGEEEARAALGDYLPRDSATVRK